MKSRLTLAGGVVALIAALTLPAADAAAPAVQLSAKLKGAKEVPEGRATRTARARSSWR